MKKYIFLIIGICFFGGAIAQSSDINFKKSLKHLDSEMEAILEATQAAGFSVAVVDRNEIVYAKGFGFRDYENKIPADENTLYAIGSSSKSFTSSLLGMLRSDEKVDFNDSPRDYIPSLNFFNDEMNTELTIKDFMCHRSGLPRHDFSWYLFPAETRDELIKRMEFHEPFAGVREQWYYNNFGFLIQGVIAENLTDKTWEENIDEMIFTPLGMERSNCSIPEMENAENASFGYKLNDDVIEKTDYYKIATMGPAGSINSSVKEMSAWLSTWINNGTYNGTEIFPEAYAKEAISSQMVIGGGIPGEDNPDLHMSTYGYGWMLSSYRGHYRVEHGGNIDGFSASACFFPSDSIGIVVLSNQNGSSVPYLVRNTIADLIFGHDNPEWISDYLENKEKNKAQMEEAEASQTSNKVEGTKPSHNLLEYTGDYLNAGYGTLTMFHMDDMLLGITSLGDTLQFEHYHYDIFGVRDFEDGKPDTSDEMSLKLSFISNPSGEIAGFEAKIEQALDPIRFDRKPAVVEMSGDDLNIYVGAYEVAGTPIKIYTKDENKLFLFVEGQPEYELLPLGDHLFTFKTMDGFKTEFLEDAEGNIEAVNMIQPNGTFKAVKK